MREVRGVVIEETKSDSGGTGAACPMPVDVAREMLRAKLEKEIQAAIRFHEKVVVTSIAASGEPVINFDTAKREDEIEPNHTAIRIPTGVGKSDAARKAIAGHMREATRNGIGGYVREAKRKGLPHRVLYLVPTHKLGEEARLRMPADITTALLQSRKANDVATGEPLCLNLPAVEAAETVGVNVERAACRRKTRGGELLCPFYDQCGYQRQKAAANTADIVFCAHQHLYAPPKLLTENTGLVVIDESFWQSGLWKPRLAVDGLGAELEAFPVLRDRKPSPVDTEQLRSLIERLQQAVKSLPTGEYITKAALLTAGLRPGDKHEPGSGAGALAKKLEWRRKVKEVDLMIMPGSSPKRLKACAEQYQFLGQLPRRAAMWAAVEELLSSDDDSTGRLRTELKTTTDGSVLSLCINGRHDVHERIAALPVIVLDATLNIEIVRYFFPRIEVALDLETVDAPNETVIQVIGLPVGKASLKQLEPGKRSPEEEERVARKRERLVKFVRHSAAGRSCLVITYKEIEPLFADIGPNIEAAHFNAIEGIDRWRNVEVLITIGRPLPGQKDVEDMAAALTGRAATLPEHLSSRGQPQHMISKNLPVRLKSGAEAHLACKVFELPEAELIRQAVTEAAVVQAIGRARGVNRTASNPVEVYMILHDTTVPVAVDAVVEFSHLEPTKIDTMIDAGLVPQWSADAIKLYPGLWPTSQAARKAYHDAGLDVLRNRRNGPGKPSTVTSSYKYIFIRPSNAIRLLRFQTKARGGGAKARHALIDLAKLTVEDAQARIEAALGQLVLFEVVGELAGAAGGEKRPGGSS